MESKKKSTSVIDQLLKQKKESLELAKEARSMETKRRDRSVYVDADNQYLIDRAEKDVEKGNKYIEKMKKNIEYGEKGEKAVKKGAEFLKKIGKSASENKDAASDLLNSNIRKAKTIANSIQDYFGEIKENIASKLGNIINIDLGPFQGLLFSLVVLIHFSIISGFFYEARMVTVISDKEVSREKVATETVFFTTCLDIWRYILLIIVCYVTLMQFM